MSINKLKDYGHPVSMRSYAQLLVYLEDVNDNSPKFYKTFYNFSVNEWNELENRTNNEGDLNDCFGKVEAIDKDVSEENSAIRFSLSENRHESKFHKRDPSTAQDFQNFYIDEKSGS